MELVGNGSCQTNTGDLGDNCVKEVANLEECKSVCQQEPASCIGISYSTCILYWKDGHLDSNICDESEYVDYEGGNEIVRSDGNEDRQCYKHVPVRRRRL